jgi:AcrR family transcriptional regulator
MASTTEAGRDSARGTRKGEILTTFTQMVAERGYDQVSLRDIAEALGMSKGTILHHYGSKDRLLEQLHAEYMRRRLDEAQRIIERLHTPTEQLAALIYQNLLLMQRDDRAATVAFAREIVRFQSDSLMADVREMRREYFEIVCDVVRTGIEAGVFRPTGDPALITYQLFGMVNWMWTWLRPGGTWGIDEIARTYLGTLLGGLAADVDDAAVLEREDLRQLVEEIMGDAGGQSC